MKRNSDLIEPAHDTVREAAQTPKARVLPPAVLCEADAAHYIQMSRSFLRKCRRFGRGPDFTNPPGSRSVRYAVADLQAWLDAGKVSRPAAWRLRRERPVAGNGWVQSRTDE